MSVLPIILLLAGFGSLGLVLYGARLLLAEQRMSRRLEATGGYADGATEAAGTRRKWQVPSLFTVGSQDKTEIEKKLRDAGFHDPAAAQIFAIFRLVITAATAVVVGLLCLTMGGSFLAYPLLLIIFPGLAYIGSKLALGLLASGRVRKVTAEFPFMLDLMYMMLQSGISLDQCLRNIARDKAAAAPILAREFALLVDDLDRGLSYELALDRWAARLPIAGARELAALFRQALFHGIELIPALREFAIEFTGRRLAAAKEAMGTITVRMVVLMILFFMPALFIVLGGPPVAAVFDTLADAGSRQ